MKKGLLIISVLLFFMVISSCKNVYNETIVSNIELYDTIWNLPERRVAETSALFPSVVEENQVVKFNCRHTTYEFVGTGWQVELVIQYTEDAFWAEKDRLNVLCRNSVVCGDSKYFDYFAYATVWNWNSCFEYAVVNEENNTIGYIYLQLINENDLTIDSQYLPNEYKMELSDSQIFSVYLE